MNRINTRIKILCLFSIIAFIFAFLTSNSNTHSNTYSNINVKSRAYKHSNKKVGTAAPSTTLIFQTKGTNDAIKATATTNDNSKQHYGTALPLKKANNRYKNGNVNHSSYGSSYGMDDRKRVLERILQLSRISGDPTTHPQKAQSITEINQVITTAGRLNRIDDALQIFKAIKKLGYKPDLMSYNNIIWSAGNVGKLELAQTIFADLIQTGTFKPNVYTYGSLMHACAKSKGAYSEALYYLEMMEKQGIKPNQIVFTSAMEACARDGQYKEAMGIMDRMAAMGMKPDITMINAAIKATCLAGAMDEAEYFAESLRDLGSMDVFTYHTLMMGHTKLGRHYRVLALYDEAITSNAALDGGVYSLGMLAALNCGSYQQVSKIAERARVKGVTLTEASYTILIQSYAELGFSDLAINCLDSMIDEGLKPNVITYSAIMTACKKNAQMIPVLLQRMKVEGVVPNTVLMTTAIDVLAREGSQYTDVAYQMLLEMEVNGPEPNIYTYNTITRAFAESGRIDDAVAILQSIKKRGLQPDRFTFTTLLIACGRNNNSVMVPQILTYMKGYNLAFDEITYGAAIDAYRRAGDPLKAVEYLHEMYKNNMEPSAAHYNLVLRALKSAGYVDKMFQMVMAISSKADVKINANTFELVIEALLADGKWKESLLLLRTMEKLQFTPSIQIYVTLVEQLEKARQYKVVLGLYKVMARDGYSFYENNILNGVFKRLIGVAAATTNADLQDAALKIGTSIAPQPYEEQDVVKSMLTESAVL